jgi:putative flippase GtrA
MFAHLNLKRFAEIIRYSQAGIVNALFSLILVFALLWIGINVYIAQIISHLTGILFNYFTYSRYVFRTDKSVKLQFFMSYAVNYLVGLGLLIIAKFFVSSSYLAGVLSLFGTAILNYFVLKHIVFRVPQN